MFRSFSGDVALPHRVGRAQKRPIVRVGPRKKATRRCSLSLALQGGGSFGAFTWGVLDRLLEDDVIALESISGSSAGAVNAVLLADGLAEGGRQSARKKLERFWRRISARPIASLNASGNAIGDSILTAATEVSSRIVSPYQFNPLGIDPLRNALTDEVDFERVRQRSPVGLLIAATRISDGRERLFQANEITLESVLASACLPRLQQAIEIDGEWYWDGGYASNPPIRRLAIDTNAEDLLLVQITPEAHDGVPRLPSDIARRVREITFNAPLWREIEALSDLRDLCKKQRIGRSNVCRRLLRLRFHRISAGQCVDGLSRENPLNLEWSFLLRLKESGRAAAEDWLKEFYAAHYLTVG
jgi:NTE family protein